MFRLHFILFCLLAAMPLAGSFARGQKLTDLYRAVVETLASDNMQGRAVSSVHESLAADYILKQFAQRKGMQPALQAFTYTDPETGVVKASKNVYGYLNNRAAKTILIGAHYDHLGLGNSKSLSYGKKDQVHNGADDNASGVALMIGLLQHYPQWRSTQYNYLFVAYSAHEIGLFGSKAFKPFADNKWPPVTLAVNFDMVGRLDKRENTLAIYGYRSLAEKSQYFSTLHANEIRIAVDENEMVYQTDACVFAQANIPALSFTTGTHDDYHKVSDDAQYINYEGMETIQNVLEGFLSSISI